MGYDLHQAGQPDDEEPEHHDRAKHAADAAGAVILHGEQDRDDGDADRQDVEPQFGGRDLQPLDRRQHRDGGRDNAVTEEQAGAGDADQDDGILDTASHRYPLRQGHQGQDAALATIVGAHH